MNDFINNLIYTLPAVAIALSTHEFAHAFVAYKLGDVSQKGRGRLTLNPLKHLDVMGTLCLLFFHFGWAKPVQVDPYFFRDKKHGMIWTAVAGPLMNLLVGFIAIFVCMLMIRMSLIRGSISFYLFELLYMTAIMSVGLGIFNLIPLPPLDGSKIWIGILSEETYFRMIKYEMYFSVALVICLYLGVLDAPIIGAREAILNSYMQIAGFLLGI